MLIVLDHNSMINVKTLLSMTSTWDYETKRVKSTKKLLGIFPTYDKVTTTNYKLVMRYISEDNQRYTYTISHPDYRYIKKRAKNIVACIKRADSSMIDAAFEEAFLKEP